MKIIFKDYTFHSDKFLETSSLVSANSRSVGYTILSLHESEAYANLEILSFLEARYKDKKTSDELIESVLELISNGTISKN